MCNDSLRGLKEKLSVHKYPSFFAIADVFLVPP